MGITAAIVIGVSEAGVGVAALAATGISTLGAIAAGAAVVGGALTVIGTVTGNQHLSQIGGIVGAAGSLGMGALAATNGLIDSVASVPAATSGSIAPADALKAGAGAATSDASAATAAATSDTGAATSGTAAASSATGGTTAASSATSPLQGPSSSLVPGAPSVDPTAGYGSLAPNPPNSMGLPGGSPADSLIAGTNGVGDSTVAPSISSGPGGQTNGLLQSAGSQGAGGGSDPFKIPPAPPLPPPAPTAPDASLWEQFKAAPLKDKMALLQTGSGVVGGIAKYLAPSPMEKAQIAEASANTARTNQITQMDAQRQANIAKQKPFFQLPAVNGMPPQAAPSPALSTSPGNAYSVNNNPLATPGLLGSAGAPTGA